MNKFGIAISLVLFSFSISTYLPVVEAQGDKKPALTIVNPLRGPQLGLEKVNLLESLKGQWQATKDASVSATWLWQYSALENEEMVVFAKQNVSKHEFGVFLEIDKNTAEKAGVDYKGRGPWYHSDGLFLVSYDLFEREKLIDEIFRKFKLTFGYYPKSVGAWWVGAQSINYMVEKYGITGVVQCADQFNTDAYSIWGTPWSIPYRASKRNAAIPAQNNNDASAVIMQWAPRDPLRAYGKDVQDSTFSLQDYQMKGYDVRYFNYLREIYAKSGNDQIVFGLEGGLPADAYKGQYHLQNREAYKLMNEGKAEIVTMKDFASSFISAQTILPKTRVLLTKDHESNNQSFWIHSSRYRLGIVKKDNEIKMIDLRNYSLSGEEEFYAVPNVEKLLRINASADIDSMRFPEAEKLILKSNEPLTLSEESGIVTLLSGSKKVLIATDSSIKIPDINFSVSFVGSGWWQSVNRDIMRLHINSLLRANILEHTANRVISEKIESKKGLLEMACAAFVLVGYIATILMLIHLRQKKTVITLLIATTLVIGLQLKKITSESERIIVTPAEIEILQEIKKRKKNIVFMTHTAEKQYRAVRPLLYVDPKYIKYTVGANTRILARSTNSLLKISLSPQELLIVPRYLGEELTMQEVIDNNLEKIFDNAQIAMYKLK